MIGTSLAAVLAAGEGAGWAGVSVGASGPGGTAVDAWTAFIGRIPAIVPIAAVARKWRRPIGMRDGVMIILCLGQLRHAVTGRRRMPVRH